MKFDHIATKQTILNSSMLACRGSVAKTAGAGYGVGAESLANTAGDRGDGRDQKGRAKRAAKGDTVAQIKFVEKLFGITA